MYFVYKLSHPISGEIGYVGITDNLHRRLKEHLASDGNAPQKSKWVKGLQSDNLAPSIGVIETVDTLEEALDREKYWIHRFVEAGCALVNEAQMPPIENDATITVTEIMAQYGISRMVVFDRIKKAQLIPVNFSPALRKQHKLIFLKTDIRKVFGDPIADRVA